MIGANAAPSTWRIVYSPVIASAPIHNAAAAWWATSSGTPSSGQRWVAE